MAAASRPVKIQLFERASQKRMATWRTDKGNMAATIPVFRALINADTEKKFHRHFGELGWASKDKDPPDWAEAEAMLTQAIEVRGDASSTGFLFYEFARAAARIRLDPDFAADRQSGAERRAAILADLRVAAANEWLRGKLLNEPPFADWITRNGVAEELAG